MKKYALVRVDSKCPDLFEKINNKFVCEINGDFKPACKNCRYGDTKEQLISKVEQIIRRPIQKGEMELKSKGFKYGVRRIAKEIVEFLGAKE